MSLTSFEPSALGISAPRRLDRERPSGNEPWRIVAGIQFTLWDRWLLRLAVTEIEGLEDISRELRLRAVDAKGADNAREIEVMLEHVGSLKQRLTLIGHTPETLLDEDEKGSDALLDEAFLRVWLNEPPHVGPRPAR
jgi:hypothetical protein